MKNNFNQLWSVVWKEDKRFYSDFIKGKFYGILIFYKKSDAIYFIQKTAPKCLEVVSCKILVKFLLNKK